MDAKLAELSQLKEKVAALEAEIDLEISQKNPASHLTFFYGESCPFTRRVMPSVTCLERHLGQPVTRKETWNEEKNHDLWKDAGGESNCGGVPYFYNSSTGESICGAADCETLKKWAGISK